MKWIDTHAHVYLPDFKEDRADWIARAKKEGVEKIYLPNIDLASIPMIKELVGLDGDMFVPMMGLHPCDVKENYLEVLDQLHSEIIQGKYVAVGEIGIDLYWDKSTLAWQIDAFQKQIQWSIDMNIPFVIHAREAFNEIFEVLDGFDASQLKGIFHCFTGNSDQAKKVMSYGGFKMGIGGVISYPKSDLKEVIKEIPMEYLVLETDAPFLTPKPYRGKRNESSYIPIIGSHVAEAKGIDMEEVAQITTANALEIFGGRTH